MLADGPDDDNDVEEDDDNDIEEDADDAAPSWHARAEPAPSAACAIAAGRCPRLRSAPNLRSRRVRGGTDDVRVFGTVLAIASCVLLAGGVISASSPRAFPPGLWVRDLLSGLPLS